MSIFPISDYDRPGIALANLLTGDVKGATTAMLQPESLTPAELKRLGDVLGGGGQHNPIVQTLIDVSTNPLFLLSLGAAIAFPAKTVGELAKFKEVLAKKYAERGPMLGMLRPPKQMLAGRSDIWDMMSEVYFTHTKHAFEFTKRVQEGVKAFQKIEGRAPTQKEWMLVAAKLNGMDSMNGWDVHGMLQAELPVTKPLYKTIALRGGSQALHNHVEGALKTMWERWKVYEKTHPEAAAHMADAMEGRGFSMKKQIEREEAGKRVAIGEFMQRFWPRTPMVRREDQLDYLKSVVGERETAFAGREFEEAKRVSSGHFMARKGGVAMIPDLEGMAKHTSEYLNEDTVQILKGHLAERREKMVNMMNALAATHKGLPKAYRVKAEQALREIGIPYGSARTVARMLDDKLRANDVKGVAEWMEKHLDWKGNTPVYSLDQSVLPRYGSTVSQELAWTASGLGDKLTAAVETLDSTRKAYMKNGYFPLLRGHRTYQQCKQAMMWHDTVLGATDWLKGPLAQKYMPKQANWLFDQVTKPQAMGGTGLGAGLANYFYMSTMGFNLGPPFKNLMQPFITLPGRVGFKATVKGFLETIKSATEYAQYRAQGMDDSTAMHKAFKEYADTFGGELAPLSKMMAAGDIGGEVAVGPVRLSTSKVDAFVDRFRRMTMSIFSATERWNRMWSFNSGRAYAEESVAHGDAPMTRVQMNQVGAEIVGETQFPAGPLGMPPLFINAPGLARQFMHFPTRYAGYLSTPRMMGGGLGLLGRTAATSIVAATMARDLLDVDLEPGLMLGALPIPQYEGSPFYPFPFVPPIASVAGGLGQALLSGDTSRLGMTASLLVPGGVAARRYWRTLAPRYVDYENPTEDGQYTVFNDQREPVAQFSYMQLLMKAVGLPPASMRAERELTQWLLKNRDQIRGYRKEYIQALYENDLERGDAVKAEWRKRFPELGELTVRPADMKALETRRHSTRIQRVMQGIPAQYRPEFEKYVSVAMGQTMANQIQESPESVEDAMSF